MKTIQNLILIIIIFIQLNVNAQTRFIDQFDGTENFPSTATPYTTTSSAYPSPLATAEMAAPNPPLRGLDASFSVIIGGDYIIPTNGGSESEGRVAVGGNFINDRGSLYGVAQSGGGTFVIGKGDAALSDGYSTYALAIAGNLNINSSSTLSLGYNNIPNPYTVGIGRTLSNNGILSVTNTHIGLNYIPVDIKGMIAEMTALSINISNAKPSDIVNIGTTKFLPTWEPTVFTGSGTKDIEVFNIDATDISNITYVKPINFENIKSGATIIINVSGTSLLNTKYVANVGRYNDPYNTTSDKNAVVYNLVWNFYEATSISTSTGADINGMIIAPYANLTANSNINGRVYIGGDFIHAGTGTEIHNYPFQGDLSLFNKSILPISLISFSVSNNQCKTLLEWATASELNNDYFEVQRSSNSINWETIGTVKGSGNSNNRVDYQFEDGNILSTNNYYRLKQVDYDGTIEYHRIIAIDGTKCFATSVKIFPVPAQKILNVNMSLKDLSKVQLTIVDVSGKRIRTISNVDANNQIDLSNIPNGSYFLQINSNNNQVVSYHFSIVK